MPRPRLVLAFLEALSVYNLPTGGHSRRVGALARSAGEVRAVGGRTGLHGQHQAGGERGQRCHASMWGGATPLGCWGRLSEELRSLEGMLNGYTLSLKGNKRGAKLDRKDQGPSKRSITTIIVLSLPVTEGHTPTLVLAAAQGTPA